MSNFSFKIQYSKGHIPALDGLRGLAILLVILGHCFKFVMFPFNNLFTLGWSGVDLFFVLSGFLITGILLDTKHKPGYYKNFIGRRTLRIFPLYYMVLALFMIFIPREADYLYLVDNQVYFWTYTQNLMMAFKGWPPNDILVPFWSLAIEEQFYLIWPFVIWFASDKNILRIAFSGMLLSLIIRNLDPSMPFAYTFTFARFDTLLLGGVLAVAIRSHRLLLEKYVPYIFVISFVGFVLLIGLTQQGHYGAPLTARFGYTLIALFYGSLLISALDQQMWGRSLRTILESNWITFLGKYSYGIYVYHWILYKLVYEWLYVKTSNHWLATVVYITLTLLVSVLSYQLIEIRFLRLKKYFL